MAIHGKRTDVMLLLLKKTDVTILHILYVRPQLSLLLYLMVEYDSII